MRNILSYIKSICVLAVLAVTSFCGMSVSAAETGSSADPESTYYIVYHDDYKNIIRRDPGVEGYEFDAVDPFFFVALPISNIAWCVTYIEERGQIPDGAKIYNTGDKLEAALTEDLHLYPVTAYGTFVRFNSQGGTPVRYQFVNVGSHAVKPADGSVVKTGYTFDGWYDNAACTGSQFDFTTWSPEKTGSELPDKEITLYAKWTPLQVEYKINIWLEKAEHPDRANLSDAQAHAFDDYDYGMTITKTGTSGDAVTFTSGDRSSNTIKDLTYFNNDHSKFPVFFYDNAYGSFAQSMSEASVETTTVDPTGATMVNVFYRRIVFKPTIGVLTTGYDGKSDPESRWDPNYQHPTVYMRDGELLGSAIQRATDKGDITLSQSTIDMFKTNTTPKTCDYCGFWKLTGYTGFTCGFLTSFWEGGLWVNEVSATTLYDSQNYILTGSKPSSPQRIDDGFTLYALMPKDVKEGNEFLRYYYEQTLDAALNNRTDDKYNGAIANPAANYSVYDIYHAYHGSYLSNGYQTDQEYLGFELLQVQDVKRNVSGAITDIDFVTTNSGGNFKSYDPAGYQLEIFYKRKSYNVSFQTGTSKVNVKSNSKFSNVIYEEPLSNIEPLIVTTGGEAFVIDNTTYTSDDNKVLVFKGWYDNAACGGSPIDFAAITMPCNNLQFYAKWEEKQITVTFDADGGTIQGESSISMDIPSGTIPSMSDEPIPDEESLGKVQFFSWTIDGKYYDFSEPLYDNTTLVALYYADPAEPFKITYKAGAGEGDDVVEFANYGYLYNANAGANEYFSDWTAPKGKIFSNWSKSSTETYKPCDEIIVKSDIVLTAQYEFGNADIIITRTGLLPGESATYAVYKGTGSDKVLVLNVSLSGNSSGSVSRKLMSVEPGTYTVEETGWSWAYAKDDPGTGAVEYGETLEFTFTGDPIPAVTTKYGEHVIPNEF